MADGRWTDLEALDKVLARDNVHRVESLRELELLGNLGRRRLDLHRKHRGGRSGPVRVGEDSLVDQGIGLGRGEQRGEGSVQRGGVEVTESLDAGGSGDDRGVVGPLGGGDHALLDVLVRERGLHVHRRELLGHLGEHRVLGVVSEVVVELSKGDR